MRLYVYSINGFKTTSRDDNAKCAIKGSPHSFWIMSLYQSGVELMYDPGIQSPGLTTIYVSALGEYL